MNLVADAVAAARAVLARNCTTRGLSASADLYPQVWARDSSITFLGAALGGDAATMTAFRISLDTLISKQDRFGQVPYLVTPEGHAEFGSWDSTSWWLVSAAHLHALSGDDAWAAGHAEAAIRALDWCDAYDLRHANLLTSGECGDWADLIANHGWVLATNVLYAQAQRSASRLLARSHPEAAVHAATRADAVVAAIRHHFWVQSPAQCQDTSHERTRMRMALELRKRPFFLPWIDGFSFGERFDTTGNLLAILTGVATSEQAAAILDHIDRLGIDRPYPVRVLDPPILPGESDWRPYYRVANLNQPDQYHNGGIWPWVGGCYVAALVKAGRRERAASEMVRLAACVQRGKEPWEFNEWLHGRTGAPMGSRMQAWSAGMLLYAAHALETGTTPGLG